MPTMPTMSTTQPPAITLTPQYLVTLLLAHGGQMTLGQTARFLQRSLADEADRTELLHLVHEIQRVRAASLVEHKTAPVQRNSLSSEILLPVLHTVSERAMVSPAAMEQMPLYEPVKERGRLHFLRAHLYPLLANYWSSNQIAFHKGCRAKQRAVGGRELPIKLGMDIQRAGSRSSGKGPEHWFTSIVRIDPLFQAEEPGRLAGAYVIFEPGARTA